jgi:hypothetical protein
VKIYENLAYIGILRTYFNPGILEFWNDGIMGFLKDIIHFYFYLSAFGGLLSQHASFPKPIIALKLHFVPNIPSFQHSSGATPLTFQWKGTQWGATQRLP